MDEEVGHSSCRELVLEQLAWTIASTSLTGWVSLSPIRLRPTPTIFIPTYCVCGLAESFLLKRYGEMGGFRDSAVFSVLIHLVMTTRPQLLSLPEGERNGHGQRR